MALKSSELPSAPLETTSIAFPSSSGTFDTSGSGSECTSEVNLDPSLVPDCFGSVLILQSARVENTSHCHYCQEGWEVAAGMEYYGHCLLHSWTFVCKINFGFLRVKPEFMQKFCWLTCHDSELVLVICTANVQVAFYCVSISFWTMSSRQN